MLVDEFKKTLRDPQPTPLTPELLALWHDGKGDWHKAHEVAQEIHSPDGAWIHAYLHRKEGDLSNATYWYHQAKRPVKSGSLDNEWEEIANELLKSRRG